MCHFKNTKKNWLLTFLFRIQHFKNFEKIVSYLLHLAGVSFNCIWSLPTKYFFNKFNELQCYVSYFMNFPNKVPAQKFAVSCSCFSRTLCQTFRGYVMIPNSQFVISRVIPFPDIHPYHSCQSVADSPGWVPSLSYTLTFYLTSQFPKQATALLPYHLPQSKTTMKLRFRFLTS